jgi:hypothetical protein
MVTPGPGQNRQSDFQQAKADHDFTEQELELKTNTELTREIHTLTTELHSRLLDEPAQQPMGGHSVAPRSGLDERVRVCGIPSQRPGPQARNRG